MKRKSLVFGGMVLSIIFTLSLIASIFYGVLCVAYYFLADKIAFLGGFLAPFVDAFLSKGIGVVISVTSITIFVIIFLLVCSTRFIKYSAETTESLIEKESFLKIAFIFLTIFIIGSAVFTNLASISLPLELIFKNKPDIISKLPTWLFSLSLNSKSFIYVLYPLFLLTGIAYYSIGYGLSAERPFIVKKFVSQIEEQKTDFPLFYTQGFNLEINKDKKVVHTEKSQKKSVFFVEQTEVEKITAGGTEFSNKIYESLAKLDTMRKNGEISQRKYIRFRNRIVRKSIK